EEARRMYAELRAKSPESAEYLRGEAKAELLIGNLCLKSDPERARRLLEAARDKFQELLKRNPDKLDDREKLTLVFNSLGSELESRKELDKGLAQFRLALASSDILLAKAPDQRIYQLDHAGVLGNIGRIL